jgi:hypothetical protein
VFDFVGVFVGVDAEVAEVAAFAAEGDVVVEAEGGRRAGVWGGVGFFDGGCVFVGPEGEGRVVGDEVVARAGAGFLGWCGGVGHGSRCV